MTVTVGIVGLGRIAGFHLQALEQLGIADVVGGVDLDTSRRVAFRGQPLPVYADTSELLARAPDTVVVATPTRTHHEVFLRVAEDRQAPKSVLVEKPAGVSAAQVRDVLSTRRASIDVRGIYHAAHAPEVEWALERASEWRAAFGPVTGVRASFSDPYRNVARDVREHTYGNSWLDSGINSLSVLERFVRLHGPCRASEVDGEVSAFEATVGFNDGAHRGVAGISTSWGVDEAVKWTELAFERDGAVLRMDHQRITARLTAGGQTVAAYDDEGRLPRLTAHYVNAFRSLLNGPGPFTPERSQALHLLLFQEAEA
jgi:predicted dehydrogenase